MKLWFAVPHNNGVCEETLSASIIIISCDILAILFLFLLSAVLDRLILSSSIVRNTYKFFDCTVTSPDTLCLNGLRVISMWWIILGHCASMLHDTRIGEEEEGLVGGGGGRGVELPNGIKVG